MKMRLVWLLLAWVMLEIGLFASIGGQIGVLATWVVVLGSAVGGVWLIRWQKRNLTGDVLRNLQSLRAGVNSAAHSALIVLAGVLLVLPGFLTDLLGLVLLIPWVQDWIIAELSRRATMAAVKGGMNAMHHMHRARSDDVIDAQVIDVTPPQDKAH
jgi:UPF0716 protein FxsA